MLKLKDPITGAYHNFELTSTGIQSGKRLYQLSSNTYQGLAYDFILESPILSIAAGYSVSVHLFKNPFYAQSEIVELRIDNLPSPNNRAGYFFRLDALFEDQAVQLTNHTYTYAHYASEYIFSNIAQSIQTKEKDITSSQIPITDLFDGDTIILVLCNEYTLGNLPNFSIEDYLSHLFLAGFTKFDSITPIAVSNNSPILQNKFQTISASTNRNSEGHPVLRISPANVHLASESFISHLFKNLLQGRNEVVTRFVILYQVIEILINSVLNFEIQNRVCSNLGTLTGRTLVESIDEIKKEGNRISWLFQRYPVGLTQQIIDTLKGQLLTFFAHINDPDYNNPAESLNKLFYGYRNRIVHNYRAIHAPGVNEILTRGFMEEINKSTEVLVAYLVTNFAS